MPVGQDFPHLYRPAPGAHPASCTMGTGSFPGVKSGRAVTLTPHPLLVPWSWKGKAIPLLSLWVVRSVQSLSACTRVTLLIVETEPWPYSSYICLTFWFLYLICGCCISLVWAALQKYFTNVIVAITSFTSHKGLISIWHCVLRYFPSAGQSSSHVAWSYLYLLSLMM